MALNKVLCEEHLFPMQVAKSVKIVMASRLASIAITLDMETIQVSQLCIDAYTVKQSILQTPKIKLKEQVRKVVFLVQLLIY